MVDSSDIKVSYNSRLKRARVEFTAAACFESWKPPRDIVLKIEDKLNDEWEDGQIETYLVFSKRFEEAWSHIRSLEGKIDPDHLIRFTIAQGGRVYSEIEIKRDEAGELAINCEISPKKMSTISFSAFLFNVMLSVHIVDANFAPDRAFLRFAYLMLKNGQSLRNLKILRAPTAEDNTREGFAIRIHPELRYASLHIFNPIWFKSEQHTKDLLVRAHSVFRRQNKANFLMRFLDNHSLEKISSLRNKMTAFGFQLPYDLLIAYDESHALNPKVLSHDKVLESDLFAHGTLRRKASFRRVQGDFLQIDIDPERMTATLVGLAEKPSVFLPTLAFDDLGAELKKSGVIFGYEAFMQDLWDKLQAHQNVAGSILARGSEAKAGLKNKLFFINEEAAEGDETLDVRERQNTRLVRKGALVAEVRSTDGIPGYRVDGRPYLAHGSAAALGIRAGDGIRLDGDCRLYALKDGLLEFKDNVLSCQAAYVHKGSVNLASGNLRFEGAVVIEGDIATGAIVDITGPLIVNGSIDGARVKCTGDLEVKGGINTGKHGYVHVGAKAKVGFIENSIVHVKDSLVVQRGITHSLIISGGVVMIEDSTRGAIMGGLIAAWQAVVCARFGTPEGQITQCRLGSHYKDEVRAQRLKARLKYFQDASDENDRSIAVFERPGIYLSPEQQSRYEYVKKNAQRYRTVLQRIKDLYKKHVQAMNYNEDATLIVKEILDKNSSIYVGKKQIVIPGNLIGVLVTGHTQDGLLDLKEAKTFQMHHPRAVVA